MPPDVENNQLNIYQFTGVFKGIWDLWMSLKLFSACQIQCKPDSKLKWINSKKK